MSVIYYIKWFKEKNYKINSACSEKASITFSNHSVYKLFADSEWKRTFKTR